MALQSLIKTVRWSMDDIEEDLVISRYRKVTSRHRHIDRATIRAQHERRSWKDCERDCKNEWTNSQKYRALKTGKMEDIVLERQFKPITEPLKQLVENTVESGAPKIEPLSLTFGEKHEEKIKESKQGIKRIRINMPIHGYIRRRIDQSERSNFLIWLLFLLR